MNGHGLLLDVVVLLGFAVIAAPIAQKIGLGSVIGYLLAGLIIGPSGLKWITETESISHVSEFGVVFLLFIIGLELDPKRLWQLRMPIFGMGFAQMALVTGAVSCAAHALGLSWTAAFIVGAGFSLSSTAVASQVLRERNLLSTPGGSSAFSILLFQDIAVIPLLAALPALAGVEPGKSHPSFLTILTVIVAVIVIGRLLLRHILRIVASTRQRDVFTALSLLIVIGLAELMASLGVSMALGAFVGGVLLATSEYRHAIETDIEPFKGLLLGLFFMSVGMTVDISTLAEAPGMAIALVVGIVLLKVLLHAGLGLAFGLPRKELPFFSIVLSQIGEFAFVLFAAAAALGLFGKSETALIAAVTAVSMATTPLLLVLYDRLIAPRMAGRKTKMDEDVRDDHPEVIIAGFGRVGQIVARLLYANRINATVLDHDPEQIESLRQFGFKVYYGDATRLDLLEAAGARTAKILVVAIDDVDDNLKLIDLAKESFPHLKIVARARNVNHVYGLIDRGVTLWERETFDSSLRMGTEVLKLLGWKPYQAVRSGWKFREHNLKMIDTLASKRGDRDQMLSAAKQARVDLENMFAGEAERRRRSDGGWDASARD